MVAADEDGVTGSAAVGGAGQDSRTRRRLPEQPAYHLSRDIGQVDQVYQHRDYGVALGNKQATPQGATHAVLPIWGIDDGHTRIRCEARAGEDISRTISLGTNDNHDRVATAIPQHRDRAQQP